MFSLPLNQLLTKVRLKVAGISKEQLDVFPRKTEITTITANLNLGERLETQENILTKCKQFNYCKIIYFLPLGNYT